MAFVAKTRARYLILSQMEVACDVVADVTVNAVGEEDYARKIWCQTVPEICDPLTLCRTTATKH